MVLLSDVSDLPPVIRGSRPFDHIGHVAFQGSKFESGSVVNIGDETNSTRRSEEKVLWMEHRIIMGVLVRDTTCNGVQVGPTKSSRRLTMEETVDHFTVMVATSLFENRWCV